MSTTTYKYKANNVLSYNTLATYAITLPVTVTLFPQFKTIAISEEASKEVGEFIDNKALDFIIDVAQIETDDINELLSDPTSDVSILRDIAESFQAERKATADLYKKNIDEVTKERADIIIALEKEKRSATSYSRLWQAERTKNKRVHEQICAISVLMNSICTESNHPELKEHKGQE